MSKVTSIDRRKVPSDLAEYILKNEQKIRSAILTVTMDDEDGTTLHMFARVTNNDLAYAVQTLQVCFITEMMTTIQGAEE